MKPSFLHHGPPDAKTTFYDSKTHTMSSTHNYMTSEQILRMLRETYETKLHGAILQE